MKVLRWSLLQPRLGSHLDGSGLYWVNLDESAPDGRSYILYRVLTLMAHTYTVSHLNDGSVPDSRSYSLYQVFTLTAQTYIESLLNDGSVLTATNTIYIGSSP